MRREHACAIRHHGSQGGQELALGGTACFVASSDLSTLLEDLALIRPTEVAMVPRVCELLFQSYQSQHSDQAPSATRNQATRLDTPSRLRVRRAGNRIEALLHSFGRCVRER